MNPIKPIASKKWPILLAALFSLPVNTQADTIVSVSSNLGNFTLELYEDLAPETVTHFLNNIEAGNYQFTMVHRVTTVWVSGGLYFYNSCGEGPVLATPLPTIPRESTGLQNDNGTIALVPDASDTSRISGQWIINLGSNQNSFTTGQEPIVFGRVTEGLETVNVIADAWLVPMDISLSVPTVNYDGILSVQCNIFTRDNVVKVAMDIDSVDPIGGAAPANSYDAASNALNIKVDAGAEGLLSLSLLIQSTEPDVIVQAQPETVVALSETVDGISTFDAATGQLTIPELVIDGQVAYTNLVLALTDADNLFFTLQSFSTP